MTEQAAAPLLAGDDAALVRRYAGSLYALAEQENAVDAVAADMRGLRRLWGESAEWRFIAKDPRISCQSACDATAQVAKISGFSRLTANFLAVVAANRRLNMLPALVEGFLDEAADRRGEYRADIRAARALTGQQHESIAASLAAVMGGKVHMNVTEDPSILGGLTIKLGSQLIDASVKTRLDHLERKLKASA